MNDSPFGTVEQDEQVWREWAHKGKMREQMRTRRRRKVGLILAAMTSVALVIVYVSIRP
jgi:hypothetical protein